MSKRDMAKTKKNAAAVELVAKAFSGLAQMHREFAAIPVERAEAAEAAVGAFPTGQCVLRI